MKKAAKKKPTKKSAPKKAPAKKAPAKKVAPKSAPDGGDASRLIEQRIRGIGGWRSETMGWFRKQILEADPDIVEERKWIKPSNPHGVPTYSHAGIVLTLEVYQAHVKVTFAYGSKVPDPKRIFNASLDGMRRAVDLKEGETIDAEAFKALVRGAVALNVGKKAG